MRRQWGWVLAVLILGLQGCSCGGPADSDGGVGGGGGAGGGSGGGAGGGAGGGGGVIDAGTGPRLLGCEVDAGTSATPECAPVATGCQTSSDCDAGLCLTLATGGVCTRACTVPSDCDTGWTCLSRWTGAGQQGFCAPARRTP